MTKWYFKRFLMPFCRLLGHGECVVFFRHTEGPVRIACMRCGQIFGDRRQDKCRVAGFYPHPSTKMWFCQGPAGHRGRCLDGFEEKLAQATEALKVLGTGKLGGT